MQVTELNAKGLVREYSVTIAAADINSAVQDRLEQVGKTAKLPGFRPGKVPKALLEKNYGPSVTEEVMSKAVNDAIKNTITEKGIKPAVDPTVEVTSMEEGKDLVFKLAVEVIPEIKPVDFKKLKIERLVTAVSDKDVDDAITRISEHQRDSAEVAEDRAAVLGDITIIDFDGSVDGVKHPGMKGDNFSLELGSHRFIAGFEEQLVGARKGEHRSVNVTFPQGYHAKDLSGKAAVFEVDIKELRSYVAPTIDDDFAKKLGFEDLAALKKTLNEQIASNYTIAARSKMKRQLMDQLADAVDFEVPPSMLKAEFESIWAQVQQEKARGRTSAEDAGKDEATMKADYEKIALRRVRLGLVLAEVGRVNEIKVTPEEFRTALIEEARRYPGQERQALEYFTKDATASERLRAPLYEDKIVDHIINQATVTDKSVSSEELLADDGEEGHVHDENCGHNH